MSSCIISILLASNLQFANMQVAVKQILARNGENVKIVYTMPQNAAVHYFNRGIAWVGVEKCNFKQGSKNEKI